MLFSKIGIIDEHFDYLEDQYVVIKDDRITYIGSQRPQGDWGEEYEGSGKVLMPGFYNAHSHSPMTLLRGYAEDASLSDWLNQRVFPFEKKMSAQDIYQGTLLATAEMLRMGIVSTTEMYFEGEAIAKAVEETGIKMNLSNAVTCFDDRDLTSVPTYQDTLQLLKNGRHLSSGGRLKIDLGLHAEYTNTPKVIHQLAEAAKEHHLQMHVHLSESLQEHEACKTRYGMTPAAYLYQAGLFDVPTTAAHCVWLEESDLDLLRDKQVTIATCPASNLKLASGICPVAHYLEHGISVALGTDGVASNNNLDAFSDMKLMAMLSKAKAADPTVLPSRQALYIATRAGALAQGRPDCGLLAVGNKADLIVVDLNGKPHQNPMHDIPSNLVYATLGSDVCMTMVDGAVLYRDGTYTTLDLESVIADANRAARSIVDTL